MPTYNARFGASYESAVEKEEVIVSNNTAQVASLSSPGLTFYTPPN